MTRDWSPKPVPELEWQDVILFDGVCVFCSRWVAFVIARDHERRFRFAAIQSAVGRDMADRLCIDQAAPETNAVIRDGTAWFKSDAAIEVLRQLPGWGWTKVLRVFPSPVRNVVYDLIARNRYRIFGRTETCMVPSADVRARFVADAAATR